MTPHDAYHKALNQNRFSQIPVRLPELEPIILQDAYYAVLYADVVIQGRWEEAEINILKDSYYSCLYTLKVIKGRWKEAETAILQKDAGDAYYYALDVVKERWKEAETIIATDDFYCYKYAKNILKWRIKGNKDFYISVIPTLWDKFPKRVKNSPDIMTAYFKETILK
jgi:hypothetical protein